MHKLLCYTARCSRLLACCYIPCRSQTRDEKSIEGTDYHIEHTVVQADSHTELEALEYTVVDAFVVLMGNHIERLLVEHTGIASVVLEVVAVVVLVDVVAVVTIPDVQSF